MYEVKSAIEKIYTGYIPDQEALEYLLGMKALEDIAYLFNFADNVRQRYLGRGIFIRGIVEISNYCRKDCFYCGINRNNREVARYRMNSEEILHSVSHLAARGVKTVVLQSGESAEVDTEWIKKIVANIKEKFDIAITLSLGERNFEDYEVWKKAGADRYLLKIETSQKELYDSLHGQADFKNRLSCLKELRILGYEVGSGSLIGLKNQTVGDIARDIIFFRAQDFDMVGIGPFIPHKETPLAKEAAGDAVMVLKALALTRIVMKDINIPATTALGSLEKDFRIDALKAGANVIMPNFTPIGYRLLYELYPGKRCISEEPGSCLTCIESMAQNSGYFMDYSKGGREHANHTA